MSLCLPQCLTHHRYLDIWVEGLANEVNESVQRKILKHLPSAGTFSHLSHSSNFLFMLRYNHSNFSPELYVFFLLSTKPGCRSCLKWIYSFLSPFSKLSSHLIFCVSGHFHNHLVANLVEISTLMRRQQVVSELPRGTQLVTCLLLLPKASVFTVEPHGGHGTVNAMAADFTLLCFNQ